MIRNLIAILILFSTLIKADETIDIIFASNLPMGMQLSDDLKVLSFTASKSKFMYKLTNGMLHSHIC